MNPLIDYIKSYVPLTETFTLLLDQQIRYKKLPKNTLLYREGEICRDFIFLTRGCLRFFFTPHSADVNVWFVFPNAIGTEIRSYLTEQPCKFNVQALQPVEFLYLPKTDFDKLRQESIELNAFYTKLCEEAIVDLIDRLTTFQFQTAEQRYEDLLHHEELLHFIPQKFLASYLGITPTSLSRLRNKRTKS